MTRLPLNQRCMARTEIKGLPRGVIFLICVLGVCWYVVKRAIAVLIATVGFVSSFWGITAIIFVLGITTGAIWIVSPVLAAEAVEPDQRGAAIGTYRTAFDLGSIIGPIVMAWVFEAYGMVPCLYLTSALLLENLVPTMRLGENKV